MTDKIAITADVPFKSVNADNEALSNLGDIELQAKYQLLQKIPLAAYFAYTLPTASREGILRTGYAQQATEVGLSIGTSTKSFFLYFAGGYKLRNNIPNQVIMSIAEHV